MSSHHIHRAGHHVPWLLGGALLTLAVGCGKSPGAPPPPEPVVVAAPPDTVVRTVTVTDPEAEKRVTALQLQLLEKDAQLQDLRDKLDRANGEVVRAMAKLQSSASRAEAASARAEAEIALQGLKTSNPGSAVVSQTERLLAKSTDAFDLQNYSGALYLAGQAREVARQAEGISGDTGEVSAAAGEVRFNLPLQLMAVRRSNVRAAPDLGAKVLFTLDEGARLTGYSFAGEWIKVGDDGGRRGWIFHTLVKSRPESSP